MKEADVAIPGGPEITSPDSPPRAAGQLRDRIAVAASLLAFRAVLDWSYLAAIVPVFGHEGYSLDPDPAKISLSWVLSVILAFVAPVTVRRPSDPIVMVLLMAPIAPMLTLLAWRGDSPFFAVISSLAAVTVIGVRAVEWPPLPVLPGGRRWALVIAALGVAGTISVMIARGGLDFATLDIAAVYLFRDAATERTLAGGMAYLADWSMKVFVPVLAAVAIAAGRPRLAFLALLPELPIFALTAQKAPLAFIGLVVLVMLLREARRPLVALALSLAAVVALSTAVYLWLDFVPPVSLATRRVFFVPAHLNYMYLEYFRDAGHVMFATVLPDWIVPYRFGYPTAQLVGDYLDPGSGLWANTGFIGSGYMHLGVAGVFLYAAALGGMLGFADQCGRDDARWPVAIILVVPFVTAFISADVPTAILTHGIGLCLVFSALIRRPGAVA